MTAEALVDLLRLFESAGIEVWLDGGWAVDAVLGAQTRPHKDVDIILRLADLPKLRETLDHRGFEIRDSSTESNFVLANSSGLESMFTPSSLIETATGYTGWQTDQTGSFRLQDLVGGVSLQASVSVAFRRKSRCCATPTGMCQPRKTCEIWNCSRHASGLSYIYICGVNQKNRVNRGQACDFCDFRNS
ncbi:MAG: lincosamide nucleotidyltransferase [Blastocatellia bacterium]|jgi:hypothetical protein|nr:lincosamide nucleotidyltransferase [Blastocatellia bacterium]